MTKFEPREKFNNIRYNLEDDNYCMSNLHKTFSNVTYQKSMALAYSALSTITKI